MISIKNIACYIPQNFEFNADRKEDFNFSDDFIAEKIGVERVSRKSDDQETSDLCVNAFKKLQDKINESLNAVDCLVVCTQNPDGKGIPHTSAIVHTKLNQPVNCACFDISLGCSGYVYALSIVKSFMESNGMKSGLLFTSDPYSKIINPMDKNTVLLFGDAATATYLTDDNKRSNVWNFDKFIFNTVGEDWGALHNHGDHLFMNGRKIFEFTMKYVPRHIKELLNQTGLTDKDVDLFLLHQGSRYMIEQLMRIMKIPREKLPINMTDYGNTVSSSIPLLLEQYFFKKNIENIILCGFGVGLSCAACLIKKQL